MFTIAESAALAMLIAPLIHHCIKKRKDNKKIKDTDIAR
jgi:hypothetical protein